MFSCPVDAGQSWLLPWGPKNPVTWDMSQEYVTWSRGFLSLKERLMLSKESKL